MRTASFSTAQMTATAHRTRRGDAGKPWRDHAPNSSWARFANRYRSNSYTCVGAMLGGCSTT